MVKRKTPLPSPRKILSAVSKKLSPTTDHFYGQEENVSYLLDMFTRTVDKGESNSLLVLGPRGVGKSALVTHVLRSVQDHRVLIVNLGVLFQLLLTIVTLINLREDPEISQVTVRWRSTSNKLRQLVV